MFDYAICQSLVGLLFRIRFVEDQNLEAALNAAVDPPAKCGQLIADEHMLRRGSEIERYAVWQPGMTDVPGDDLF